MNHASRIRVLFERVERIFFPRHMELKRSRFICLAKLLVLSKVGFDVGDPFWFHDELSAMSTSVT